MPELPEVETTVRGLRKYVVGKTITDFWCDWPNMIRYTTPATLGKLISGSKIVAVRRRAKHILIDLKSQNKRETNKTLVIHMKMTGHLLYGQYKRCNEQSARSNLQTWRAVGAGPLRDDPYNRFIHAIWTLVPASLPLRQGFAGQARLRGAKMHLAFSDMRKFGRIALHDTHNLYNAKELENLGPELWDLDVNRFIAIYLPNNKTGRTTSRGTIKQKLLDQRLLAGVGNIYADESLWASGIHPLSRPSQVPKAKLSELFRALVSITKQSLKTGGDSMSDYRNVDGEGGRFQNFHKAYKQTGKPCTKRGCKGIIKRIVVSMRGTHYCPKHQILYA